MTPSDFRRTATRLRPLAAALAMALMPVSAAFADAPTAANVRHAFETAPTPYAARLVWRDAQRRGLLPEAGHAPAPQGGVTRPVTSCADDADPGTLRNVLAIAGEGDTIDLTTLTCSTITLTQGPIDTSVLGDNHLYDVTINGPGRDLLTIEAGGTSQVFVVGGFSSNQGRAIFNDLTIAHGDYSGGLAGCITGFGGAVELNRVTVTDCHSRGTVPLVFAGAVDVTTLEMTESVISHSSATATGVNGTAIGGASYASGGMTLVDSTVSGNTVTAPWGVNDGYLTAGGGLYSRGNLVLTRSTISGNTIGATNEGENARGGGVFVRGVATIIASTIDGNSADGAGGGVFKEVFSNYGDPPPPQDTKLIVTNTTISGNSAASGGGIVASRPLHLANSTIGFNHATGAGGGVMFLLSGVYDAEGTLTAQSSIIASNTSDGAGAADLDADDTLAASGANNLVMAADSAIALPGDTLAADPLLLPLSSNGGPTRTHALGEGSPAVDTGNNAAELEFDQRGEPFARVSGTQADIGAYERQQPPASDVIFRDGFDGPAAEMIEYAYDDGDGDNNIGPPSSFDPDMLWGNYYLAQPGGELITRISVAFGPTFPSLANGPVTFWLLQDPDADFDPGNAFAIASVQGTPDVFNDTYFNVELPPTWVQGGFFVAASAKLLGGEDRPARSDSSDPGDKSWFYYAPDIAATIDDLASAPFGTRMDNTQFVPFPGAFMIRATGESAP